MALFNCSECKKEISDRADSCPHCGNPVQKYENLAVNAEKIIQNKKAGKGWIWFCAFVFLCFVVNVISYREKEAKNQENLKAHIREREELVAKFNGNRSNIIKEIKELAAKKDDLSVVAIVSKYETAGVKDVELEEASKNSKLVVLKLALSKLRKDELRERKRLYQELVDLFPKDATFKKELVSIQNKIEANSKEYSQILEKFGERPQASSWDGSYRVVERYLERVAKNPDSIKMDGCTEAKYDKKVGWLVGCNYFGTNSFNAVIRQSNWFIIRHQEVVGMLPAETYK